MTTLPEYPLSEQPGNNTRHDLPSAKGYRISGTVIHGNHLGRTLGFPTANIDPGDDHPPSILNGVYLVQVELGSRKFYGLCNIGDRPTIGGNHITIEVYILNFSEDIYGQELTIGIISALREERKFSGLEQLTEQIRCDKESAIKLISALDQDQGS